eukprot:6455255-Amphidinium_carterae.3
MKLAVFADGSPGAKGDSRGQGEATTDALHDEQSAPMTPVMWRSGKLDHVTANGEMCEVVNLDLRLPLQNCDKA